MQDLTVTLVQANLVWENKQANLSHLEAMLNGVQQTQLIVLPEMFSTGFSMQSTALAENMMGPSIDWMRNLAEKKNAVVCGSLIIEDDAAFYNRLIWMQPDGMLEFYDKRHLFSLAGEEKYYKPGKHKIFPEIDDWKFLPLICYDLRFPVWSRQSPPFTELGAHPYDVLVYVANWPERRSYAWEQLLIARAIENQCYVIGVNRVGDDGNGVHHNGLSCIIDPMGKKCLQIEEVESAVSFTLSASSLQDTRLRLPFLDDRDEFELRR
ncbi:MAG TPA: amidohydrolase [Chitinophagales bacterium]|nr:amidohydrolase [Chitinophagales bacterium]